MFGIACMEELTRGAWLGRSVHERLESAKRLAQQHAPITTTVMPALDANGTCTCISSGGNSIHPGLHGSELVMIESS